MTSQELTAIQELLTWFQANDVYAISSNIYEEVEIVFGHNSIKVGDCLHLDRTDLISLIEKERIERSKDAGKE